MGCWAGLALVAASLAGEQLAPEVSHDPGVAGGVVLLWPRVVPAGRPAIASAAGWQVQRALASLVREVAPDRPTSVRPEPERVCPRAGCVAMRVGALIVRERSACAVVATVGPPGVTPLRLIPWVGAVRIDTPEVPFRDPPENSVAVGDFVPCDRLSGPLTAGVDDVRAAVVAALAD
ncbi:MAG: hypothetical protein ACI8PZ_001090 [Myxococcota bacterium]|jgi:hypothetical protein